MLRETQTGSSNGKRGGKRGVHRIGDGLNGNGAGSTRRQYSRGRTNTEIPGPDNKEMTEEDRKLFRRKEYFATPGADLAKGADMTDEELEEVMEREYQQELEATGGLLSQSETFCQAGADDIIDIDEHTTDLPPEFQ